MSAGYGEVVLSGKKLAESVEALGGALAESLEWGRVDRRHAGESSEGVNWKKVWSLALLTLHSHTRESAALLSAVSLTSSTPGVDRWSGFLI